MNQKQRDKLNDFIGKLKDKEYVYLYDNDYQLNKRLYPIANVARLDIK